MPSFSSRKHIIVFTTSWEVCEANYSSYIIAKHSNQVPSLLVRGSHFIYLLKLLFFLFFLQISLWLSVFSWNCSYFGQENKFVFCDMLAIGDIRKQVEKCDIGFRLHVASNFLGLMSQLNGSITSIFFLKMCIKSHCLLPGKWFSYFTDQWSSESRVFFCLNHNRVRLIFKLVYIQISCRKIYSSPASVDTLVKETTGLSH